MAHGATIPMDIIAIGLEFTNHYTNPEPVQFEQSIG